MPPPTARQKVGETDIFKLASTDICTLGLQAMSTQITNVSDSGNLEMSLSLGPGGGRARSPGVAQRPTGVRGATLETAPVVYRAGASTPGS
jgi:hypothetical protein